MSKRLVGVLLVVLLGAVALAAPAGAAESQDHGVGEGEGVGAEQPAPRSADEVVADNDTARQFVPEPYEQPTWFRLLQVPLLIVGVLVTLAVLFAFLRWQPAFAQERQQSSRRR